MNNARGECGTHFSIVLEDLLDLMQPTHIEYLGEVGPLGLTRGTHETAVLSRHPEPFNVSQVLCQEIPVAAGDDVYQVLGVRAQSLERLEGRL